MSFLPRGVVARGAAVAFLVSSSFAMTASAAADAHAKKRGFVDASMARVLSTLLSSEICNEGCRYHAPSVQRVVKLKYQATETSFYRWSHFSGGQTVKFFNHYTIQRGEVTTVFMRTLTEERDAALIAYLEKKTGLEHKPLFDLATTKYSIVRKGDRVLVDAHSTTRLSGLMSIFSGMARREMKKSLDAMFENFGR